MLAYALVLGLAPFGLMGCATHWGAGIPSPLPRGAIVGPRGDAPTCVRLPGGAAGPHRLPLAGAEKDPELAAKLDVFPHEVRRVVLAAGLEPSLARLLRARETAPPLEVLSRRQSIDLHLQSLKAQLDAAVYEADCGGDLIEHLRHKLEQSENAREIRWTVASIIVQAVAAVAVGALELSDASRTATALVGVGGGVAASGFGVAAFVEGDRQIVLDHARNLLSPIAKGEDAEHLYPSFVFRLLTLPQPNGESPAARLRTQFEEILREEVPADERERARELLYGSGGIYDTRLVVVRERMFDALESTLAALSRDFELLQRHLVRLLGDDEFGTTGEQESTAPPSP